MLSKVFRDNLEHISEFGREREPILAMCILELDDRLTILEKDKARNIADAKRRQDFEDTH